MDETNFVPADTAINFTRREHLEHVTEIGAHNQQVSEMGFLKILHTIYVEKGLRGIVLLVIISPVMVVVGVFAGLREVNMWMGNISPLWYKIYMDELEVWLEVAAHLYILLCVELIEVLHGIFPLSLLMKLLVGIPLLRAVLYGLGILSSESDLLTAIVAGDLLYVLIGFVATEIGGFEDPKITTFIVVGIVIAMGHICLVERA